MVVIYGGTFVPLDMKKSIYDYFDLNGQIQYSSQSNTDISYELGTYTGPTALGSYSGTNLLYSSGLIDNYILGYASGGIGRIISWEFSTGLSVNELSKFLSKKFANSDYLSGADTFVGRQYNDHIIGLRGADSLMGFGGDDIIQAGNGRDTIDGGSGSDILYGGFGKNYFNNMKDGYADTIYFKSDQWAYNYVYGKAGNSPNGEKCDIISDLDPTDRIVVQGAKTSDILVFQADGGAVGIFVKDEIEGLIPETTLSLSQLTSMVSGDLG